MAEIQYHGPKQADAFILSDPKASIMERFKAEAKQLVSDELRLELEIAIKDQYNQAILALNSELKNLLTEAEYLKIQHLFE